MKKYFGLPVLALLFTFCAPKDKWVRNVTKGGALGTTYAITYLSQEEMDLSKEIDSVFMVINKSMSTYKSDSDISKINLSNDSTLVVDHMFRDVFELSKQVYEATDGAFDPTVGVLANAWGFGPGEQLKMDSIRVDSLKNYVGFDKVTLNEDGTISKQINGIAFDFNSIAKGYTIDRLGVVLDNHGIANYLIEVGGEVLAKGNNKLTHRNWAIGIDDPQSLEQRVIKKAVYLRNKAMASSGNYRKFWIDEKTGEKYVHTLDPKTGYPKNSAILATSVLAKDCATADAFATAFMVMQLEKTKAFLKSSELDAYIIYLDENGITQEFMTAGFEKAVIDK